MSMRVAIVSYYAPPDVAVASHRVLRMSRSLIRAGHEVHWVTLDEDRLLRSDPTLAMLIPRDVVRHGLGGPTLSSRPVARNFFEKIVRTVVHHLPAWLALPDKHIEWARRLKRMLPALSRQHGFDAVVLTCGPHGQLLSLPGLRDAVGDATVIVDYRDLLSGNPWTANDNPRVQRRLLARERRLLAYADILFVNSNQALSSFRETFRELNLSVTVMRNAADYELADDVSDRVPSSRPATETVIGYFGTIFPKRRLTPVLRALELLPAEVLASTRMDVYCDAGDSKALLEQDLGGVRPEVAERVVRHDYVPYGEALARMRSCAALLLVNGRDPADSVFVPGKLFDYVMARRPVLFVGGAGDARDIVARTSGTERCFSHEDPAGLATAILALQRRVADLDPVADYGIDATFAPLLEVLSNARKTS